MTAVYSEIHTKPIEVYILENAELLNIKKIWFMH